MKKFNQAKHMLFRHVLILLGVMVTSVSAFAQQAVSGTVTDASGGNRHRCYRNGERNYQRSGNRHGRQICLKKCSG